MSVFDDLKAQILSYDGGTFRFPTQQEIAIRKWESMRIFADGEPTFVFGEWKAWEAACFQEGRTIPPAEFKALPEEQRMSYLPRYERTKK